MQLPPEDHEHSAGRGSNGHQPEACAQGPAAAFRLPCREGQL